MAAGPVVMYHNGWLGIVDGTINWSTDTIKAALLQNAYTPNAATHVNWSDISANEVSSTTHPDYAQQAVTTVAPSLASGVVTLDANDVDFGNNVTISARYLVLYKDTGVASTSRLICYVDLNDGGSTEVASSNANFDIQWSANGLYQSTV